MQKIFTNILLGILLILVALFAYKILRNPEIVKTSLKSIISHNTNLTKLHDGIDVINKMIISNPDVLLKNTDCETLDEIRVISL